MQNGNAAYAIGVRLIKAETDLFTMLSESLQAFNHQIAASSELQAKLNAVNSPIDFLTLAKTAGYDLTPQDFQTLVQQAHQQWIERLDPQTSQFFSQVHGDQHLNDQLKNCQSSADAIALAHQCGIELSVDDLQQAAAIAESIVGFSFEKRWFRQLGLIQN
jgi:predicted ribosomally synthesized peptide with nif11-like leader